MFQWAGFSEAELANLCIVIHNVVVWWCGERTEFGGRVLLLRTYFVFYLCCLFISLIGYQNKPTKKDFVGKENVTLDFDS